MAEAETRYVIGIRHIRTALWLRAVVMHSKVAFNNRQSVGTFQIGEAGPEGRRQSQCSTVPNIGVIEVLRNDPQDKLLSCRVKRIYYNIKLM